MQKNNLAARAGRWSAQHRKRAILGWILFVVLATVVGGAVGQRMLADEDMGNGESRAADQAVAAAGFPKETGEQVLVQAKGKDANHDARFTAAVDDVVTRLDAAPHVKEVKSPYAKGNEGQLSRDGSAALVTFKLAGRGRRRRRTASTRRSPPPRPPSARTPSCASSSSATPARTRRCRPRSRRTSRRRSSSRCRSRS